MEEKKDGAYDVLICDDDEDIRSALKIYLTNENYSIIEAENGAQALEIVEKHNVRLLLMDIMTPVMDGTQALSKLRAKGNNVPVILLTAKSRDSDKVFGLNAGADDYITKPFNPVEVIARVKSQIRRYTRLGGSKEADEKNGVIRNGVLEFNYKTREFTRDGDPIALTPTEALLLKFFMERLDAAFSPKELYREIWGDDPLGSENTVTVHIRHLREKIEIDPANPDYIKVVWGRGYKMAKREVPKKLPGGETDG